MGLALTCIAGDQKPINHMGFWWDQHGPNCCLDMDIMALDCRPFWWATSTAAASSCPPFGLVPRYPVTVRQKLHATFRVTWKDKILHLHYSHVHFCTGLNFRGSPLCIFVQPLTYVRKVMGEPPPPNQTTQWNFTWHMSSAPGMFTCTLCQNANVHHLVRGHWVRKLAKTKGGCEACCHCLLWNLLPWDNGQTPH